MENLTVAGRLGLAHGRRWFLAVLLLTVAVSAALLLLPLSAELSGGQPVRHRTLLAAEGPGIIVPLAVPALICALPLLAPARHRRGVAWGSAGVLVVGVLISLLSVGVFFVPSAILLAVGAGRRRS
jgi:hypothetical protein